MIPEVSPETSSCHSGSSALGAWGKLVTLALKCLHVLLVQPAASESETHRLLVCRLVAFLLVNSKEDCTILMVDCVQIMALKWENSNTFETLCHAVMDEVMHNLTLGSLLRHTSSSPLRGSGAHLLSLLKGDLRLRPLAVAPLTPFPDFAGKEVLDRRATPQLSLAAWFLSNPSLTSFTKTVIGHKAQLFGHVAPDEGGDYHMLGALPSDAPELSGFEGFSADFCVNHWNTSVFMAATNAMMAPPAPNPQDHTAGAALCELLGYFAFVDFHWQGQLQGSILERYYVSGDGTCKVVLPGTLLQHSAQYQPLLAQASVVLTNVVAHLLAKLSALLGISRGGPTALAVVNGFFRQFSGSHLMCYIHREILCKVLEGQDQDTLRLRMETDAVKRKLQHLEGEAMQSSADFL